MFAGGSFSESAFSALGIIETAITPAVGTVVVTGAAPSLLTNTIITPSVGTLTLVGGTFIISNPNWIPIVTTQTPNWLRVAA